MTKINTILCTYHDNLGAKKKNNNNVFGEIDRLFDIMEEKIVSSFNSIRSLDFWSSPRNS